MLNFLFVYVLICLSVKFGYVSQTAGVKMTFSPGLEPTSSLLFDALATQASNSKQVNSYRLSHYKIR